MTPSYESVCNALARRAEAQVANATDEIERAHKLRAEHVRAISQATGDYMATGIADLRDLPYLYIRYHGMGWGHRGWDWSQYFRGLAKDLGRPYVRVSQPYYDRRVRITLPKRRYLDPLVAALRLVCEVRSDTVSQWFSFNNDQAELYPLWRKQCATDPAFRKALRLP